MNYRILDQSEWNRLNEILDSSHIPHPDTASAAVAEDHDGNIVGVLFLQIALHMEPLVLKSPKVNFERLHDVLYNALQEGDSSKGLKFYVFSDKEVVDKMAEHVGMQQTPFKVFVGEVE